MSEAENLDLYDSSNPISLLYLLRNCRELVASIKELPPHLIGANERDLRKGFKPDDLHERLKISFWDEYRRAQRVRSDMLLGNIINGICSYRYFWDKVRTNRNALAWLISPPPDEMIVQKQLLQIGMKRMREVLELPLYDVTLKQLGGKNKQIKKVNVALIKEMRSIVELLANRVHGAVIQRQQIEAKTLSVNVDGGSTKDPVDHSLEDIERSLKKLEKMASKAKNLLPEAAEPETIDGEVEP